MGSLCWVPIVTGQAARGSPVGVDVQLLCSPCRARQKGYSSVGGRQALRRSFLAPSAVTQGRCSIEGCAGCLRAHQHHWQCWAQGSAGWGRAQAARHGACMWRQPFASQAWQQQCAYCAGMHQQRWHSPKAPERRARAGQRMPQVGCMACMPARQSTWHCEGVLMHTSAGGPKLVLMHTSAGGPKLVLMHTISPRAYSSRSSRAGPLAFSGWGSLTAACLRSRVAMQHSPG